MITQNRHRRSRAVLRCFGSLGLLAALLCTAERASAADLAITAGQTVVLSGSHIFDTVTIAGTLKVRPFDPEAADETGWLELRAANIRLADTGRIDGDGAGWTGSATGGNGAAAGGNPDSMDTGNFPLPGGGGGHLEASGGSGVQLTGACTVLAAAGQDPNGSYMDPLGVGVMNGNHGRGGPGGVGLNNSQRGVVVVLGGAGGGGIILRAATMTLDGAVSANGEEGQEQLLTLSGSGAGGTIYIACNTCSFGPAAKLTATGGASLKSSSRASGAGAGGFIYLPASAASDVQTNVDAGLGSDPCATPTAGAAGLVEAADAISCLDADDDGYESATCGGLDCGDGDALVSPNATEICNGIDDDCDGEADEEPPEGSLCPVANELCHEGACVTQTPPPASELGLHGGLCSLNGPYPGLSSLSAENRSPTSWAWFVGLMSIFLAVRCPRRP